MIGPYTINVYLNKGWSYTRHADEPDMVLQFEDVIEGDHIANRFYRSGGGATLDGTERAAQFYIASLLQPGEEATIVLVGKDRGERAERSGGGVRRDAQGRAFLTYGSRFGERHFKGV